MITPFHAWLASSVLLLADAQAPETTMKAVRLHAYGGADALVYEDAPRPVPKQGEVLVKVHAAGVNPVDWKLRSGAFKDPRTKFPLILGFDVSGVVESVGAGVEKTKPGDEVYAYLSLAHGGGYAEYVAVPESDLAKKPASLDHAHAGAVPLAALTAWQALFDTAGLKEGQTVLVHGGAGGVGHFAVQLAKAKGAKVIATGSETSQAFLKELGADVTIDYRAQKFEDVAKDVDVVLDTIGGDTLDRSYGVLRKGGFLVSIVARTDSAKLKERELRGATILVKPDGKELAEISALIEAGKVKPHVSETFPLAEAGKAHAKSETGHVRGKLVLLVR
jgi:NADPH:quinone reductase-like Zn-dependent oxidoreductase